MTVPMLDRLSIAACPVEKTYCEIVSRDRIYRFLFDPIDHGV
jgi:hypothetical protein